MPLALAGNARDRFVAALHAQQQGDRFTAAYHYRTVLDAEPRHPAALRGLAKLNVTAREALKFTHHKDPKQRARAVKGILSLADDSRLRALLIALRNTHYDVRVPAIEALGATYDKRAVKPLLRRLMMAGGNPQSVYIAQTRQIAYVQDYDVEIA